MTKTVTTVFNSARQALSTPFQPAVLKDVRPPMEAPLAKPVSSPTPAAPRPERDSFQDTKPAPKGVPRLSVPDSTGTSELPYLRDLAPENEAAQAQADKGWAPTASVIAQRSDTGCGEATLAFLSRASRSVTKGNLCEKQERESVRERASQVSGARSVHAPVDVNLDDGATPTEMATALGGLGIEVTDGFADFDAAATSKVMKAGQFGLALVDSNAILNGALAPEQRRNGPGQLHWVTLDGVNSNGTADTSDDLFRVKDPVNGEYWVAARDLERAVQAGKEHHGSGGIFALENRTDVGEQRERDTLAQLNRERTASFADKNGVGSKRLSLGESS
ncbi:MULTISPECIES: hypothetical protein [Myxococcus]|uniref:hypothetical protein n=1 Tax=Myxococcus TaxID=32 RepID=UPI00112689CA|nr:MULTISPECIES: hypothetical protein [Myxococcus]QDF07996.1 hypothetical protein BHS04_33040 [Myxococcus xanthus]WAM25615.1 hypothetical protein OZ403_34675 [Myxococcus sp. NMCA1]